MTTTEELYAAFPPTRAGRGAPSMFPRKLFQILTVSEPGVIEWDEDGESFHIVNYKEFVEQTMPKFYRHNKLTSFQRQLNLYGFRKRGRDERHTGHYYHPYFQRDCPELLDMVRRTYPSGVKGENYDSGSMDDDYVPNHLQSKRAPQAQQHPGHMVRTSPSHHGVDGDSPPPYPRDLQEQHSQQQNRPEDHYYLQQQPSLKKPCRSGFDRGNDSSPASSGRMSEWCLERAVPASSSVTRDEFIRNQPHRPWFYSGTSEKTAAVVRQEVAARRSGPSEPGASQQQQPYEEIGRVHSSREGDRDIDIECGGGGDRSRGGDGGGGGAAGRGGYYVKTGGDASNSGERAGGLGYRDRSVEYLRLSKYTSSDNDGYPAAAWDEHPRAMDVLNQSRQAEATKKAWADGVDGITNGRRSTSEQQQSQQRREACFRYPPTDGEAHQAQVEISSTVFPHTMVRRSNFLRSTQSELESRFRAPPPPMPPHPPAYNHDEAGPTGYYEGHPGRTAPAWQTAPVHSHAHAAALPGWRPVWVEHANVYHQGQHQYPPSSDPTYPEDQRRMRPPGGGVAQELGVRFRERESGGGMNPRMDGTSGTMNGDVGMTAFSAPRSAAAVAAAAGDPPSGDGARMPAPVVRRAFPPRSSSAGDAGRSFRPPSVTTPPPPASPVPREHDDHEVIRRRSFMGRNGGGDGDGDGREGRRARADGDDRDVHWSTAPPRSPYRRELWRGAEVSPGDRRCGDERERERNYVHRRDEALENTRRLKARYNGLGGSSPTATGSAGSGSGAAAIAGAQL